MPELIEIYTAGNTLPLLQRTRLDLAPMTGWTIKLRIERRKAQLLIKTITETLSADGQITDTAAGDFRFTFVAADLVFGLLQPAEIEFDDGAGGIQTEKEIFFNVKKALG